MKRRRLGESDLLVSEVCLGTMTFGQQNDEATAHAQLDYGFDQGINFIDTAEMYPVPPRAQTCGATETIIGNWLANRPRDRIVLATKVAGPARTLDWIRDGPRALDRANIRAAIEGSLRRLRTDHIDVLQIHHQLGPEGGQYLAAVGPPPRYAYRLTRERGLELGHTMQRMVQDGKTRFLGVTAWDGHPGVIEPLLSSGVFHTAQILYNLLNLTAASAPPDKFDDVDQGQTIPIAQRNNIGIIGIRAHAAGALSDHLDREAAPDSEVARDFARSRKLSYLKRGLYSTLSQVALRFCLDNPHIATVVPGIKNLAELEEIAACSGLPPLDADRSATQLESGPT